MPFCGKCGAPVNGGKFCPQCGAPINLEENKTTITKSGTIGKKVACAVGAIVIAILIATRCSHTVDEPCDWCGNKPSIEYETSDGTYSYVCKECSKVCAWCGEKAKEHYENLAGMIVFVCEDCYQDISN